MNAEAMSLVEEVPREQVYAGWIHAFGLYKPRWQIGRHLSSAWSQAVLLAKRRSQTAIERFGRIIAGHLESVLLEEAEYVITHVPAELDREMWLFLDWEQSGTEMLARAICRNLETRFQVVVASVLIQVRPKPRKQHQCVSDAKRAENVRGLYAVTDPWLVAGKNVVLVDDILTSGATMRECASVLRTAGARNVMGVTLARTARLRGPTNALESHAGMAGVS